MCFRSFDLILAIVRGFMYFGYGGKQLAMSYLRNQSIFISNVIGIIATVWSYKRNKQSYFWIQNLPWESHGMNGSA